MNFGYFDEENREYVITKPNTPAPWCNYLGSPEYGAIISNNAGGYSFVKSGANGRILRYHFNSDDTPGRYIYLRDDENGDYWSASWQPVGKDLNEYKSEVHHGTAYTKMFAEYAGIKSEAMYYVPLNKVYEVWCVKVTNNNKLTDENIDNVVKIFTDRKDIDYVAKLISNTEIGENDYNLSVSTYVEKEDTREKIDIIELNKQIEEIVAREQLLRDEIDKIVKEIEV